MCLLATPISPLLNRLWMPHFTFSEILRLSSCAKEARSESISSPSSENELMRSFSNRTSTPMDLRWRTVSKRSTVFLANRLIDLVIIMSMLPASQSSIIRLNSSRFLVLVPEIPSSAKIPENSHSSFFFIKYFF